MLELLFDYTYGFSICIRGATDGHDFLWVPRNVFAIHAQRSSLARSTGFCVIPEYGHHRKQADGLELFRRRGACSKQAYLVNVAALHELVATIPSGAYANRLAHGVGRQPSTPTLCAGPCCTSSARRTRIRCERGRNPRSRLRNIDNISELSHIHPLPGRKHSGNTQSLDGRAVVIDGGFCGGS